MLYPPPPPRGFHALGVSARGGEQVPLGNLGGDGADLIGVHARYIASCDCEHGRECNSVRAMFTCSQVPYPSAHAGMFCWVMNE